MGRAYHLRLRRGALSLGEQPEHVHQLDLLALDEGDAGDPVATGTAPVIRLRADMAGANDGSVYRYDRMGLLAAIEAQVAKRRA